MNRRNAVRLLAATPVVIFTGCEKKAIQPRTIIEAAALVAAFIGKRMVDLPNPAMRIIGIVLVVGSEVTIDYLDYSEAKHSEHITISTEESQELQNTRKLVFQRHDLGTEDYPIWKDTYATQPAPA